MNPLDLVKKLEYTGHFAEALRELEATRVPSEFRLEAQLLRAELMERVGRAGQARLIADAVLKVKGLTSAHLGRCEYISGKVATEDARIEDAITHLQRAVSLFERCGDIAGACKAHTALMLLVSRSGPDAATPLVTQLRRNVTKLGDPVTTAALHVFIGEMEVKRGLFNIGRRHAEIASRILRTSPNVWLEARAETIHFAIAILLSDLKGALAFGYRALDLAQDSGGAGIQRSCLGNLGNYFLVAGNLEQSAEYFKRALAVFPSDGENNNANLDGLARVRLAQDKLNECADLLDRIDASIRADTDRALYGHRYAELTRAQLLARQGSRDLALARADFVVRLAESTGDEVLYRAATLLKAEILQQIGRVTESLTLVENIVPHLFSSPPGVYAQYERLLTDALARNGDLSGAGLHRARAMRIGEASGAAFGLLDSLPNSQLDSSLISATASNESTRSSIATILHSVNAVLGLSRNFELTARELLALLDQTDSAYSAMAIRRDSSGTESVLAQIGGTNESFAPDDERRLFIGERHGNHIELFIRPRQDVESVAIVNAIKLLLSCLKELQNARAEREERATLWPVEELPSVEGQAVITGHMRELMTLVERVASVNISVLIFGESGTGKEIIARAIHDCSDRAKNAFVPVNCAAVPRELMESQLFGHRRGAFTGADRDFAGFIRAADNGTLFLDEIAELSLDLQPKLLRFLESGEIAPIGEPAPLHVNVRVLAATNKNLEELVREGRFREDLFYRLNVVPLTVRPLRERRDEIPALVQHLVDRAAVQFKKGHLTVAEETMERLLLYRWPGNVRQLQHELQRIVALAEPNSTILPEAISAEILGALPMLRPAPPAREMAVSLNEKLPSTIARIECEMIKIALRDSHGKVDAAAKALGISRKGLYLKRQRLGL
jgi:DNA-binding NtrC family response regulator/tetratricopeptide (TPR) repeat protein